MEHKIINPAKWQDPLGFVQGHQVSGAQSMLFCAGQISIDPDGKPLHVGDFRGQLNCVLDNIERVLQGGGFTVADIVRVNIYTTDLEGFFANRDVLLKRFVAAGGRYASTLLGISRLARPEFLVEIEVTAAK